MEASGVMSKGGGDDTQEVKQTSTPWGPQATRYSGTLFPRVDQLLKSGGLRINPYPGQTVAPTAPETAQAWQGTAARAQAGSPLNQASSSYLLNVLRPEYLTSDSPGLSSVIDQARQGVNAQFAMGGRTFSGAHAGGLGSSEGQLRYQDFARKAAEQAQAAQFAPTLAREDYFDLGQLGQVGSQREAQMQDLINADIQRYNALQQAPINELALYKDLISGNLGGTTTGTQPVQQQGNPALGLLGGIGQIATGLPWASWFGGA
jgi:hypothetical protein